MTYEHLAPADNDMPIVRERDELTVDDLLQVVGRRDVSDGLNLGDRMPTATDLK